jgi:acetyl-CoA acetyltransferase
VVYVAGAAVVRAGEPAEASLEELVFEAAAAALTDAGTTRAEIDGVCLAASDQLDGRVISSMHLAGPAGGYLRDEVKVADDGSAAFAAAVLRLEAGASRRVLAVAWAKREGVTPTEAEAPNPSPVYEREVGLHPLVAEALVAQMFTHRHGIPLGRFDEVADKLHGGAADGDGMISSPLRRRHLTPETDAAVALVLSTEPAAVEVAGLAWGADNADPLARAAAPEAALAALARRAYRQADMGATAPAPLVETTERNVFRLCISAAGLGLVNPADGPDALLADRLATLNAAGGRFRGEAMFAAGLERIAHAARAVAGGADSAVAHSSYGRAGQGQLVTVLRRPE